MRDQTHLMFCFRGHEIGPNVERRRVYHSLRLSNQSFELIDSQIKQHSSLTQRSLDEYQKSDKNTKSNLTSANKRKVFLSVGVSKIWCRGISAAVTRPEPCVLTGEVFLYLIDKRFFDFQPQRKQKNLTLQVLLAVDQSFVAVSASLQLSTFEEWGLKGKTDIEPQSNHESRMASYQASFQTWHSSSWSIRTVRND